MKDYTIINFLENKIEFTPKLYTAGDAKVPYFQFNFHHLYGLSSLEGCKLELRYALPNGFIIDEYELTGITHEVEINGSALIQPGWCKVQAILKSGKEEITLPGDIVVRVRDTNISDEKVEPVYEILVKKMVDLINSTLTTAKEDLASDLEASLHHTEIVHRELIAGANSVIDAGKKSINNIVSAGIDSLTLVKESAMDLINASKLGVTETGEELKTSLNTIFDKAVADIKEVQKKSEADIVARGENVETNLAERIQAGTELIDVTGKAKVREIGDTADKAVQRIDATLEEKIRTVQIAREE